MSLIDYGTATFAGTRYSGRNEDRVGSMQLRDDSILVVMCDGHGSIECAPNVHKGGSESAEECVSTVVSNAMDAFSNPDILFEKCQDAVRTKVDLAHPQHSTFQMSDATSPCLVCIRELGCSPSFHGSTCTVVAMQGNRVLCSYVGDTSCVFYKKNATKGIPLTEPHNCENAGEHERVISAGATRAGPRARGRPRGSSSGACRRYRYPISGSAFVDECMLTRSVGHFGNDIILHEPEIVQVDLSEGVLMLATDGITDVIKDEEMAQIMNHAPSMQQACDAVARIVSERSGKDNATIACVRTPLLSPQPEQIIQATPSVEPEPDLTVHTKKGGCCIVM